MIPVHPLPTPGADADTVLVAGGTGFVGRAVVRAIAAAGAAHEAAPRVRMIARRRPAAGAVPRGVQCAAADLTDRASVTAACAGVTTLVHAVTYVGRDPERCDAVNRVGTRTLIEAARRAGVQRILYISTTSVYGEGPHRCAAKGELPLRPRSEASASRLDAEHMVREAGGIVLRPHLIFGEGDRWVVPTLARLLARVPYWGASSHSSVIAVEDLARLVAALVRHNATVSGEVYHAAHPRPVCMRTLVFALCEMLGLPRPGPGPSAAEHWELCTRRMPELTAHQHALLTQDHWYDSNDVWRQAGLEPGPGVLDRLATYADWYTHQVRATV